MEGYDVVTNDDHKVGHVVGERSEYVLIEHGTLFKSTHAVPKSLVHFDEDGRVARLSMSKEILQDGPKVEGDKLDEQAVAAYYGLAEAEADPETEGFGVLEPDETAVSSEVQATRDGADPAGQERARIRSDLGSEGQGPGGESPGLLGDRYS
ncbi:MAG: hypothetical protein H0U03_04925 [Actinobacteria bacterium]|nr:hypothetical protein [Actinomycetota bacterium]